MRQSISGRSVPSWRAFKDAAAMIGLRCEQVAITPHEREKE